jgi:uncharacterized protein (TIGR02599 family)
MKYPSFISRHNRAFTLVELIASMVLLTMLMLVCVSALDSVRRSVTGVHNKAQQFREARQSFELITKTLSQATLNPYWDYYYKTTGSNTAPTTGTPTPPTAYIRFSELQFQIGASTALLGGKATPASAPGHAAFFQAPLGLTNDQSGLGSLLNARGYAIQFGDDNTNRPPFLADYTIPVRYRYRLVEYRPPAEQVAPFQGNTIYTHPTDWFRQDLDQSTRIVAENIILLVLSPRVSAETALTTKKTPYWLAPSYTYNSLDVNNATPDVDKVTVDTAGNATQGTQHLLPPLVVVTMVALDEASAAKWALEYQQAPVDYLAQARAPFTDATAYDADLASLEAWLNQKRLNYTVFSSTVPLRNARWDSRTY